MLTDVHKAQRMASALTSLEQYHKDGDGILNHIVQVSGGETWVLFFNVETKEQSKSGCTRIHQTTRKSLNKRYLPES
jgi:hypothetical protein